MNFSIFSKKFIFPTKWGRIITYIVIVFFFSQLITCTNFFKNKNKPEVIDGIINLKNWDFAKDGPINLSGNWEFYPNKFINSGQDIKKLKSKKKLQYVPKTWNTSSLFNQYNSGNSYGSYRLTIILNENNISSMAIKTLNILSNYNIFINGEQISSAGKVGKNKESSIPGEKLGGVYFSTKSSKNNNLELVIQVSNFHHKDGGIIQTIILGQADQISNLREKNITIEFFFFGAMIIMALYHIGIFTLNKYDKSLLYFGLLCFTLSLLINLSNERVGILFTPDVSWEVLRKFEYLSIYLSLPLSTLYLHSMFKKNFNKKILFVTLGIALIFILFLIFNSISISSYILQFYKFFIVLLFLYILYILIILSIKRKSGAKILLCAFLFLLLTITIDVITNFHNSNVNHALLLGLFTLVFSNAYLVTIRFTNAVDLIEDLTEDLAETTIEIEKKNIKLLDLNWNLEQKVKSRTEELEKSNQNLIEVCKDLETAQEEAKNDLELAIRVQRNFLPKRVPKADNWEIAYHFNPMSGVSGDFYDFFEEKNNICGIGIFDVSGHGIASGLITTLAKSIIHRNFINNTDKKLNEILTLSNRELQEELKEIFHYVTGVLLRFKENMVEYVSAGHPEIIIKQNGKSKKVLNTNNKHISGSILGIKNIDNPYEQMTFDVSPGDFILLYTDGFIESSNENKESFDIEKILEYFDKAPIETSQSALNYLLDNFYDFIDNKVSTDDITLIMLKKL